MLFLPGLLTPIRTEALRQQRFAVRAAVAKVGNTTFSPTPRPRVERQIRTLCLFASVLLVSTSRATNRSLRRRAGVPSRVPGPSRLRRTSRR
jgi:hypothetical protein